MAVYIITGKLGGGKTLCSVGLIRDALLQGRRVATNIDLNLEYLLPWTRKNVTCFRLPDRLSEQSFLTIGHGNPALENGLIDENNNGLLVLDEGGLALNSRDYREEGRKEFIRWGIHSRKNGWDMAIIIQHIDALDKQVRDLFGEHVVTCSRMDRMRIPGVGWILQGLGFKGTFGKLHKTTCRYGQQHNAPETWVKWFQGKDLYAAFNTRQVYDPDDGSGVSQYLTPWHIKGRHHSRREEFKNGIKRFWQIHALAPVGRLSVFFSALLLGGWLHATYFVDEVQATIEHPKNVVSAVDPQTQTKTTIETINSEPEQIDPWDFATISTYIGNVKNGYGIYKFRIANQSVNLPDDFDYVPINPCSVILKHADKTYFVNCKKS
jgi:hypothetical protein